MLSVLFNIFLIRDNLDSRLADVIVPGALLWAWLLREPWAGLRRSPIGVGGLARAAGAAVVMLSIWMAVDVYAGSTNQLAASEMFSTPLHAARRLKGAIVNLRQDPLEQFAPAGSTGLRALTRYVNRCTAPTDRLLVLGYQPEMFFYADRRIGGGNAVFHANSAAAPREQETIIERLKHQHVPVVVLPVDQAGEIESVYPILKKYIRGLAIAMNRRSSGTSTGKIRCFSAISRGNRSRSSSLRQICLRSMPGMPCCSLSALSADTSVMVPYAARRDASRPPLFSASARSSCSGLSACLAKQDLADLLLLGHPQTRVSTNQTGFGDKLESSRRGAQPGALSAGAPVPELSAVEPGPLNIGA